MKTKASLFEEICIQIEVLHSYDVPEIIMTPILDANVPDPYFFPGFEGFEKVFKMVDLCIKDFLEQKCR